MADPGKIMERVRALGANVVIDGGGLKIRNGKKLPAEAVAFIKANAAAIADWLDREGEVEERAAIVEYDGGAPRAMAERFARECIEIVRSSISELDRTYLLTRAGAYVDEVVEVLQNPQREAA